MIEKEVELIMWHVLIKLINMRKWGGSHSELKRVLKSLPLHFKSNSEQKRRVNKAVKTLVNFNFIFIKPSTGELHVSLNPRKSKEISEFINRVKDYF